LENEQVVAPEEGAVFAPAAKPRVWTAYLSFFAALSLVLAASVALTLAGLLLLAVVDMVQGHGNFNPARLSEKGFIARLLRQHWFLLLSVLTNNSLFLGISFGAAWFSKKRIGPRLGLVRPATFRWWLWAIVPLGAVALSSLLDDISILIGLDSKNIEWLLKMFGSAGLIWFPPMVLFVGVLTPFAEEILFRGYIQTRLVERHGPAAGLVVASVMFGVIHLDPLHGTYAVFLGLYLGFMALRFRSIYPAILAHAAVNILSCVGGALSGSERTIPSHAYVWCDMIVCACITATALWLISNWTRKISAEPPPLPPPLSRSLFSG
jgi:membrane protease YdiL (CAAX protease family)